MKAKWADGFSGAHQGYGIPVRWEQSRCLLPPGDLLTVSCQLWGSSSMDCNLVPRVATWCSSTVRLALLKSRSIATIFNHCGHYRVRSSLATGAPIVLHETLPGHAAFRWVVNFPSTVESFRRTLVWARRRGWLATMQNIARPISL